jgi:flagellar M-ring protein FliF
MANPVSEQVRRFFGRLSVAQRITIFIVVAGVLTGLYFIYKSAARPEMAVLYSSLEPSDASKIVETLNEQSIEYELKENGTTILIDKNKLYDTRIMLAGEGLPETSQVGYEIFDKTNLGMSEFVQKLNYRRALEGELVRTISSMQEVSKARVHIVIPEKTLFEKDQQLPTASVTLSLRSGRSIGKLSVKGIQNLVASSVEGMDADNVIVVDQRGKILSESTPEEGSVAGLTSAQNEQQKQVEQYLSGKVQSLLDGVLGPGNTEVRVNAELDFTQIDSTITDYDPERQVERSTQRIEDVTNTTDSITNSYENLTTNESSNTTPYLNRGVKQQVNEISNYEIKKTVSRIIKGTGTIKRLSVAALINGTVKVVDKEGQKAIEYVPRTTEEMQKLEEIIKNAVGYDPINRNDQISVLNVPFYTRIQEEDLEQYKEIPWWKKPDNQKLLVLIFVMLLTGFILYKLLSSKPVKDRIRMALSLPEKAYLPEETEEDLRSIEIDDESLLLMPPELPEPLLLEGEKDERELRTLLEDETVPTVDKETLLAKAKARLEGSPELTESALMKQEIKKKVEDYLERDTEDALKLIKILIGQDASST